MAGYLNRLLDVSKGPEWAAWCLGGRRPKLNAAKRREIAESVLSGRKTSAEMTRLYGVSQPTVSRIVAEARSAAVEP